MARFAGILPGKEPTRMMPSARSSRSPLAFNACLATWFALAAPIGCSTAEPPTPAGSGGSNAGGAGGAGGKPGGTGGTASGGSGAATGGNGGTGTGGAGTGGAGTGGAGGSSLGGAGGGGGSGGAPGTGGAGDAGPGDAPAAAYLDDCFAGLRTLEMRAQTATKRSADGAYQLRLALEVPQGMLGTSGTVPWTAVRLAIVTPQKRVCIKDEAALKTAYTGSHHNCSDTMSVTVAGLTYLLKAPDTDPQRAATTLTITGEAAVPAVTLTTASCTSTSGAACKSGGPC
jgi:hypothetical protein